MKFFYLLLFLVPFMSSGQETLQTVTDRGTSTAREVQFVSASNPSKYTFIGGSPGYARIGAFDPSIGFDKLIVEASKLGLGVINPSEKFELEGFIKSGNISFGHNTVAQAGPRNYMTVGGDGHASLLIGSNLMIDNDSEIKVSLDHPTLSGAGIFIPGNSRNSQNSIQFHTNPVGSALAGTISSNLRMIVTAGGNVGIGTANPQEKLSVNGKIRAKEVKVEVSNWPDYVFDEGYELSSLSEIEQFIKINKHLPEIPSAKKLEKEGLELGEMNKLLLKKIEELTLLLIEQDRKFSRAIAELKSKNNK